MRRSDGSAPSRMPTVRECLTHTCGQGYPFFNETVNSNFKKDNLQGFGCTKASIRTPWVSEPGTQVRGPLAPRPQLTI